MQEEQQEIEGLEASPEQEQQDIELAALLGELEAEEEAQQQAETGEQATGKTAEEKAAEKVYKALGLVEVGLMKKYPFLVLEQVVGVQDGEPVTAPMRDVLTGAYTPVAVDLGLGEMAELPPWAEKVVCYGLAAWATYECASAIREQVRYHEAKEVKETTESEPEQEPEQEPIVDSQVAAEAAVLAARPLGVVHGH